MKRVLLTGASGFIGSNLLRELIRRKYYVRIILKREDPASNIQDLLNHKNVEVVRGNLRNPREIINICKDVETVFHLAAKTDLSTKSYRPYYENNVLATKNLAKVAGNVKSFIYYSSILTVGLPNTKTPLDEKYEGDSSTFYGRSKVETEKYLLKLHRENGFPVIILRPSTVYGPFETLVQYLLFKVIKENKFFIIGNGNNLMSYLYVGNLIDITIKASKINKGFGGVFFINDSKPYRYEDVINTIFGLMKKDYKPIKIPFWIAMVGAYLYSKVCNLVGVKALIYPSRVKTMVLNYVYDIKKAKKILGYKPKYNLKQGMKLTYNWYKERGLL